MFCNIFDAVKVFLISKIAPQTYKRQVTADSSSSPNVLNRPIIEVWNASISSQNNPQSCHLYELMSPWGFTFRQNISEMEVDIYVKILFRQDSFQIRALMTTDTSETSSVDKKFPELLKVSRGFRPILRPWPFLQTILMFNFRILAPSIYTTLNWKVS